MQITRILPYIIRLFPEIARQAPPLRNVFVLGQIEPLSDELVDEALNRDLNKEIDLRLRRQSDRDNQQVIKLAEVREVLKEHFTQVSAVRSMAEAIKNIIGGVLANRRDGANFYNFVEQLMDKMRENALRQNTVRTYRQKVGPLRPAVGHGHGR